MKNPQKITIIDGGIVGICCALSLQERGYDVLIIERDEEPVQPPND